MTYYPLVICILQNDSVFLIPKNEQTANKVMCTL